MTARRRFLQLASGLFVAPAIVRAESIMPVKVIAPVEPFSTLVITHGWDSERGLYLKADHYHLPGVEASGAPLSVRRVTVHGGCDPQEAAFKALKENEKLLTRFGIA